MKNNFLRSAPLPPGPWLDRANRARRATMERYVGIDIGTESLKVVELVREGESWICRQRTRVEHGKAPGPILRDILQAWEWGTVTGAAVTGRLSRQVNLPRVPTKQAQAEGYRFFFGPQPATVVSVGSHGFSVLELRPNGMEVFRENSRCSQGTGNFLRQLVERFSLSIEEASELCADLDRSAPLSGRCPVILKTDMTHLANKGENRAQILAGLFDAVCENVLILIKPGSSPAQVALIGGVSRSRRVRNMFRRSLARNGMSLMQLEWEDALFFEAIGSALAACKQPLAVPALDQLLIPPGGTKLERLPGLSQFLPLVRRMQRPPFAQVNGPLQDVVLGFDIGSTGSKAVAWDVASRQILWEGYRQTGGDPVDAAQALLKQYVDSPAHRCQIRALGVTGSGREIVGSLMTTCYGKEAVFILNEIAAHAEGARHFDPRVDTIFEIGGQDAKYIRLAGGRVVDCAMNEACSAGTGSFIEEQGRKFAGIRDIVQLAQEALSSNYGVSLGQHCSVFMAEIIDEAVAAGVDQRAIIAGLYDSIIQNYLHRVKGSRSVGQVIFCQGMPFASDALAAAVARQTGSQVIVPPNPGTVGALGIALLTLREIQWHKNSPLCPALFLGARVEHKETFVCKATTGCGGNGNRCRIDCIKTIVSGQRQRFSWGGGCSLHDKGTRKKKLPDLSPDPFREREELVWNILQPYRVNRGLRRVALSDEFMLKGLFPFFAAFLHQLGFDLAILTGSDQNTLKRGIQGANVPFCAPMQLFHGLVSRLAEEQADFLFLPMVRAVPQVADEQCSVTCPIVQASPDVIRWDMDHASGAAILTPIIDIGRGNFESKEFLSSCRRLAAELGIRGSKWRQAHRTAKELQIQFEQGCVEIGQRALDFCTAHGVAPVVVLGRPYTIYSTVLNSNVPAILREQGTVAIPADCYPVDGAVPIFHGMYWGYGQRLLRAAHQIRRTPGVYSLYCSNYSCGPDSFNLQFYTFIMEGKPFAIIETDGHAGDAGTKTRVEAFLHCVQEEQKNWAAKTPNDFQRVSLTEVNLNNIRDQGDCLLIPWMGPGSVTVAACMRGLGIRAETLPMPDRDTVRIGRRHTSGKECLPMCLTLGGLLKRVEQESNSSDRFVFLMPRTQGPCRLGVYNLLDQIALERLNWRKQVRIWSPAESGYFDGTPPGWAMLVFTGFMASDLLLEALLDVRPVESRPGTAQAIYSRSMAELSLLLEHEAQKELSMPAALWQVATGRLFGVSDLLAAAAAQFKAVRQPADRPTVLVVGEIYVRCDPFANDFIIERLEARGLRSRLAPLNEWLEYVEYLNVYTKQAQFSKRFGKRIQDRIQRTAYSTVARVLGWPSQLTVPESLAAAGPYIRQALTGEAVLTVGGALHEWRQGHIDAVVSVGPLECLPNKIAEAQFFHIAEQEGLLTLTLSLNGDPVDPEIIDNFAFEVHARYQKKHPAYTAAPFAPRQHLVPNPPLDRPVQFPDEPSLSSPHMAHPHPADSLTLSH